MTLNISSLIEQHRPNIKKSTLNIYTQNIKNLNNKNDIKSLDFLKNPEDIIKIVKDKSIPTQRNYLNSALVVLEASGKEEYKSAIDKYQTELKKFSKKIDDTYQTKKKTFKESKNWLTYDELKDIQKKYKKEIDEIELNKKDSNYVIKPKQNKKLLYYLISSLYTLNPPLRLDWANMTYTKNKKDLEDNKKNWLYDKGTFSKIVYLNDFKNVKKIGPQQFKLNKELARIINLYRRFNKGEKFLLNTRGFSMSQNSLAKMLPLVFTSNGKSVNLNMIRKAAVVNTVNPEQVKKEQELAEDMLHSVGTQKKVYLKTN